MSLAQQQELESKYVMGTFARKPVEFVSGNGMTLTDDKGKQYLDFIGGIGVISLSHCAPALVKTLQEQNRQAHARQQLLLHRAPRRGRREAVEHSGRHHRFWQARRVEDVLLEFGRRIQRMRH